MQGGGARRRREARGGDPTTRARAGAGKGVGTTPGTPWHQRVPVSGGPDIEGVIVGVVEVAAVIYAGQRAKEDSCPRDPAQDRAGILFMQSESQLLEQAHGMRGLGLA